MFKISPQILVWLAQSLYFLCFIPQIIENYRLKTGKGLSDFFLLAYLNTFIALFYYIFCLNLPMAYKILVPTQGLAGLILIIQRLYYNNTPESKFYGFVYLANILAALFFIPPAIVNPVYIGHIFGWGSFILILVNQLPQVIRVMSTKSVRGFSYLFVLITASAAATELYTALILHLPMQTILSASRGLVYFAIFSVLFWMYKE
jgi:uncharacterized protein with PQ loop repeat